MDQVVLPPVIDVQKIQDFGRRLFNLFGQHVSDRKYAEEKWLQNLRAYRGIYDPEILALIGKDQSKAYPKMLRWKLIGTVARLMQMLFPSTEKNYSVRPSPLPDLSITQLQEVLDTLVNLTAERDQVPPEQVTLKDEDIEKAIYEYAAHKAEYMEKKVDDDLAEMDYVALVRRVVFSACLYSLGVLKGPFHVKVKARSWKRDQFTGKYTAIEVDKFKPRFDFLRLWDYFPDLTANTLKEQDGTFERHVMMRQQVEELIDRPDFIKDRIETWLRNHPTGNYKPQWWETVIKGEPKSDRVPVVNTEGRKYEVLSYWGAVTGHELRAAGVAVTDAQLSRSFTANVWHLEDTIIKCKVTPLGEVPQYHWFMFEEDDLSVLGNSQADTLRDSQISICETARAALDNMSVIGPMAVVNDDLLTPGQDTKIVKHKTWHIEGLSSNQNLNAAVGNVSIDSHLTELQALLQMFMEFANQESGLPPPSVGDTSGGGSEALRTSKNASMFLGAAALPLRDTVRNFDAFTVSVIGALVEWNKRFDPNPVRDGDMDIIPRGSTSLVAKEVLAGNLAEFRASITEDELPDVNPRKMLMVRAKANDIPVDEVLEDEDVAAEKRKAQQQAAQSQQALQETLVRAQVQEIIANAVNKLAAARKADATVATDAEKLEQSAAALILEAVSTGNEHRIAEKVADKPVPKAGAK